MSHAFGLCRFPDGTIFHVEYNATVNVVKPTLHPTVADVRAKWRQPDNAACSCGCPPEVVEIYADYGGCFYWIGAACRQCCALVGCRLPFELPEAQQPTDGVPDWVTEYLAAAGKSNNV